MIMTLLTPQEAAQKKHRYLELKHARLVITATGETLTQDEARKELDTLAAELKAYIEEHDGRPIETEGEPDLTVQSRSTAATYDVRSFAGNEPLEYQRALDMGGLTFNVKVLRALVESGQLTKVYEQYGQSGQTSALIVGKEKNR